MATTTRYWDCSGGACGCAYLPLGPGTDSNPAHCHSNAMFAAPEGNVYGASYYGAAAISRFLWDGNTNSGDWLGEGCGKCWKVTGSSNVGPNQGVSTTLVLKGTNICPTGICNEDNKAHFDIAAPGFDVLEFSWSNTCAELEADELEGFKSCGRWMIDSQDPSINCDCSKFNSPVLRAGCENFYSLQWDNAEVTYEEVACPEEIDSLPCFGDNGPGYPQEGIPETCMDPHGDPTVMLPFPGSGPISPPTVTPPTVPPPTLPTAQPASAPTPPEPTSFPPIDCPDGYETARWTWYISYPKCCPDQPHYDPDASTDECTIYNGCAWDGDFAYVGHRPFEYVQQTDIIAFFSTTNNAAYGKQVMRIYSPVHDHTVEAALVLDTCGDLDCNGCCTENANAGGTGFLVDMEENTVVRHFGSLEEAAGLVCFQVVPEEEYDAGGYCNWSGCDGAAQGGWDCNLNSYECESTCAGSWCTATPTTNPPPVSLPPTMPPSPIVTPTLPPTSAPMNSPTPPPVSGNGDPCCTWDFKECSTSDWCNESESNCRGSCGGPYWMDVSGCAADGIGLGEDCTANPTKCCPGLQCVAQSQWYSKCELMA